MRSKRRNKTVKIDSSKYQVARLPSLYDFSCFRLMNYCYLAATCMGVSKESDVTVAAVLFLATKSSKSYKDKQGLTSDDPLAIFARVIGLNTFREKIV